MSSPIIKENQVPTWAAYYPVGQEQDAGVIEATGKDAFFAHIRFENGGIGQWTLHNADFCDERRERIVYGSKATMYRRALSARLTNLSWRKRTVDQKIVVHTGRKPGDRFVEEMEALNAPDVQVFLRGPCRTPAEVLEAVRDADVGLCGREPYTEQVFAGAPKLKMVIRYGVGVDTIDLDAATRHGVVVGHLPDFCIREVANHALVLLLNCAKKVPQLDRAVRQQGWGAKSILQPMGSIHGETVGLFAFGNIARALADRLKALQMRVIAYDPFTPEMTFVHAGVKSVSMDELAQQSNYVSCHLPLNPKTRGMIDASFFQQMKPTAYFVNTSRGGVVKEADLIAALTEGRIAGAGLDVFEQEPISPEHPFCQMDNVVLTPHTASYSDKTMEIQRRRIGKDALAVCRGGLPDFCANPQVLAHRRT